MLPETGFMIIDKFPLLQILIEADDFVSINDLKKKLDSNLISSRLKALEDAGIVESKGSNYKIIESKRKFVKEHLGYINKLGYICVNNA